MDAEVGGEERSREGELMVHIANECVSYRYQKIAIDYAQLGKQRVSIYARLRDICGG